LQYIYIHIYYIILYYIYIYILLYIIYISETDDQATKRFGAGAEVRGPGYLQDRKCPGSKGGLGEAGCYLDHPMDSIVFVATL